MPFHVLGYFLFCEVFDQVLVPTFFVCAVLLICSSLYVWISPFGLCDLQI